MRVHSFLPLEDIEDKNNGCLLQISQAVRSTAPVDISTKLTMTATRLTRGQAPPEGFSCMISDA